MLTAWLTCQQRNPCPYTQFAVLDVNERGPISSQVMDHIKNLLISARLDPDLLKVAAQRWGWRGVAQLLTSAQPTAMTARRGEFGEVLSAALLTEFEGYQIPVQKFRFTITPDQSLPGTDLLALKVNDNAAIIEVCFLESKLRTGSDTGTAVRAYNQLRQDYEQQFPDMLVFVLARLHERRDPLLDAFLDYLRDRADTSDKERLRVGLTWERGSWTETVLQNLEDNGVERQDLVVHVVYIGGLAHLIDQLFQQVGVGSIIDDDE